MEQFVYLCPVTFFYRHLEAARYTPEKFLVRLGSIALPPGRLCALVDKHLLPTIRSFTLSSILSRTHLTEAHQLPLKHSLSSSKQCILCFIYFKPYLFMYLKDREKGKENEQAVICCFPPQMPGTIWAGSWDLNSGLPCGLQGYNSFNPSPAIP